MNTTNGLTAIKDIFAFPFRDPHWKNKLLIGSGITFAGTIIPVLPWLAVLGYGARIARRSAAAAVAPDGLAVEELSQPAASTSGESTLPEWDDWGELFKDGLRQLGVTFLVSLPLLLLVAAGIGFYFLLQVGVVAWQVDSRYADPGTIMVLTLGTVGVMFLTMALVFLLTPVTYLFLPAAAAHVAVTRSFGDFFRAGEWLRVLRANLGGYFALLFILAGLYLVYMVSLQVLYLTIILCLIMPVVAAVAGFFVVVLFYHLSGLAYAGGSAARPATAGMPAAAAPVESGDAGNSGGENGGSKNSGAVSPAASPE